MRHPMPDVKQHKTVLLGQNESFDEFTIGGIPIVYSFASPLVTKILCMKLKQRQQAKQMCLKAANFIKVNDDTSALRANMSNKILAIQKMIYTTALLDFDTGLKRIKLSSPLCQM